MSDPDFISLLTARQTGLSVQLRKIKHVYIIGVGGIGSWVAIQFALSGVVENLTLIDDDYVDPTNLNRTPFRMKDIANYKVAALKEMILERRPIDVDISTDVVYPTVTTSEEKLLAHHIQTIKNSADQFPGSVLVVDCRDDIFRDLKEIPGIKLCKVGYDGLSVTLDMNPKMTNVWGGRRGYNVTPSFIVPSMFIANLIVMELLCLRDKENLSGSVMKPYLDKFGPANEFQWILTFDLSEIIPAILLYQDRKELRRIQRNSSSESTATIPSTEVSDGQPQPTEVSTIETQPPTT